jgi:alpha-beta hydrolase superfamily lysophospholipase
VNWLLVVLAVLIAAAAVVLMRPLEPAGLAARPDPARDYEEAVARVHALEAEDGSDVDHASGCGTLFLTHGHRTERVVVFFHGLTNCPAQFDSMARLVHGLGANVLVPRLPRHGLADRMTDELARIDAGELRACTDRAVDVARGLGTHVTVVGLSVGGTMAAWAAQHRSDVDQAVLIAPLLEPPGGWPEPLERAATRLAATLPNTFVWWDRERHENLRGPRHVYPRFSTRAAAASLLLGADVRAEAEAKRRPPGCRNAAFVTVEGDRAVGSRAIHALAAAWRARGARVESYEFPATVARNHDVIDPEQVGANPGATYPPILRLAGFTTDPKAAAAP